MNGPGILRIWNTNCDQLTRSKLYELKQRIDMTNEPPDIIAISEVRAKNATLPPSIQEYQLDGYSAEGINIDSSTGRGMITCHQQSKLHYNSAEL